MAVQMRLGGQIREHREAMSLSQDDLASKIFVSRQTVSNWENGRTYPDVQNLLLLAKLFGITLDELVKGDVEEMNNEIKRNREQMLLWFAVSWVLIGISVVTYSAFAILTHGNGESPIGWLGSLGCWTGLLGFAASEHLGKLEKNVDVKTFRELVQYSTGQKIDRTHCNDILPKIASVIVLVLYAGILIFNDIAWM
ncbi:helix-turn-helix transcriptional regulator [Bifidobacterium sp. ESL0769]|uniref:helix-turn-helix domain-containing protein n=1 Tax=Bifidobacterium sp. ESL0769 TaxID=2983229 RepID=UPI0023F8B16A|nr:helix-turn-helix transcriptional regulator [Bifidobacterium sp. ESL0769]WEV67573.1 helix-turn-helix transcriptional regulator [Bifidobacterium sp. ESL0769]